MTTTCRTVWPEGLISEEGSRAPLSFLSRGKVREGLFGPVNPLRFRFCKAGAVRVRNRRFRKPATGVLFREPGGRCRPDVVQKLNVWR